MEIYYAIGGDVAVEIYRDPEQPESPVIGPTARISAGPMLEWEGGLVGVGPSLGGGVGWTEGNSAGHVAPGLRVSYVHFHPEFAGWSWATAVEGGYRWNTSDVASQHPYLGVEFAAHWVSLGPVVGVTVNPAAIAGDGDWTDGASAYVGARLGF